MFLSVKLKLSLPKFAKNGKYFKSVPNIEAREISINLLSFCRLSFDRLSAQKNNSGDRR